ncbi:hypothetical protein ACWD4B_20885 [Streptomyces sp. NPDC002536]
MPESSERGRPGGRQGPALGPGPFAKPLSIPRKGDGSAAAAP